MSRYYRNMRNYYKTRSLACKRKHQRENGCLSLMQNRELTQFMREEAPHITDRDRLMSTLSEEQQIELKASSESHFAWMKVNVGYSL